MTTIRSFLTGVAPINAMPAQDKLNRVELLAKLGKYVPNDRIKQGAELTEKVVKKVKQEIGNYKTKRKTPVPE